MRKQNPFILFLASLLLLLTLGILTKYILFKEAAPLFDSRIKKRHSQAYQATNFELFATIKKINNSRLNNAYKLRNIAGNIIGFLPLGLLLPVIFFSRGKSWKTVLLVFFISLLFETIQLYTGRGVFDVDDLLLNTTGGLAGFLIYRLFLYRVLLVPVRQTKFIALRPSAGKMAPLSCRNELIEDPSVSSMLPGLRRKCTE